MKSIIDKINEEKKCPYCDINNKELDKPDGSGKELPNCGGENGFEMVYQDWGDPDSINHILIANIGRRGGYYTPKYCPECGRKLD